MPNKGRGAGCGRSALILTLLWSILGFAQAAQAENRQGIVLGSIVNLRSDPGVREGNVMAKLLRGQEIDIEAEEGEWLRIRAGGSIGWVRREFVGPAAGAPAVSRDLPEGLQSYGVVLRERVNLRARPNLGQTGIETTLPQGQKVEVLRMEGSWYLVKSVDGRQGWILAPMISLGDGLVRPETYLGAAAALVEAGCRREGARLTVVSKSSLLEGARLLEQWLAVYSDSSQSGRAWYLLGLARAALAELYHLEKDSDARDYAKSHPEVFTPPAGGGQMIYGGEDFERVLKNFPQSSAAPMALLEKALARRSSSCPDANRCDFRGSYNALRDVFRGKVTARGKELAIRILLDDLAASESQGFQSGEEPAMKETLDEFLSVVMDTPNGELRQEAFRRIAGAYKSLNHPDDAKKVFRLIGPTS